LLILGGPGSGKSAFSVRLTQVRGFQAYLFCTVREGGSLNPIAFARSSADHFARRLPGFADALTASRASGSSRPYVAKQDIDTVKTRGRRASRLAFVPRSIQNSGQLPPAFARAGGCSRFHA